MEPSLNYETHPKERVYFILNVIAALVGYSLFYLLLTSIFKSQESLIAFTPVLFYMVLIGLYVFFRRGIMTGFLQGNSVKVSENQFPAIHDIVVAQSNALGLKYLPDVYIFQSGGALNAFAMRFFGANYVVLNSDIVEEALANSEDALKFIVGHELGHVKRRHMTKFVWLFPAFVIPFVRSAYSRSCEYTCDNIGHALCPEGSVPGLLILAAGKSIWKQVNYRAYQAQEWENDGFWAWFAEKVSSHPRLTKRVGRFEEPKVVPSDLMVEPAL